MKYSSDWCHKNNKIVFYDGKKIIKKQPNLKKGDEIYCENLPLKIAKPLIDEGVKIYRVHQNLIADYREGKGIEKNDENDATLIYEYSEQHPENFHRYYGETKLKLMYATFKETQKLRVATGQRVWASGDEGNGHTLKKIEGVEKDAEKELLAELEKYPVWTWLKEIKGIGTLTSAGLIAHTYHISDIKNGEPVISIKDFPHRGNLYAYSGLEVKNGKAPKPKKGEMMHCNPKLKSLLLGVIADSFVKQRTETYRAYYETEKQKYLAQTHPAGELSEMYNGYKKTDTNLSKGHAEKRARRSTAKLFVSHYWEISRWMEGLPLEGTYAQEKLGHGGYIKPPCPPKGFISSR